jgi:hypothetical protein
MCCFYPVWVTILHISRGCYLLISEGVTRFFDFWMHIFYVWTLCCRMIVIFLACRQWRDVHIPYNNCNSWQDFCKSKCCARARRNPAGRIRNFFVNSYSIFILNWHKGCWLVCKILHLRKGAFIGYAVWAFVGTSIFRHHRKVSVKITTKKQIKVKLLFDRLCTPWYTLRYEDNFAKRLRIFLTWVYAFNWS